MPSLPFGHRTDHDTPAPAGADRWLSPRGAAALAVVLALGVALADWFAPSNVILPMLYVVPQVLAARLRAVRFLWLLTSAFVLFTLSMYWLGPGPVPIEARPVAFFNRVLCSALLLNVAVLLQLTLRADRSVRRSRQQLARQNAELEAINLELEQREEEIVRQNEELQASTEELERQSEELRVSNDDLAQRERVLERLLELSRALSADLPREDILRKICEATELLTDGHAATVLERTGDRLLVRSHAGFGPGGPAEPVVPYDNSFAELIMSLGQTGYLQDLSLRPDLVLPRPRQGEPLRAVLASPLRVHGRVIGALEAYARQRQSWTDDQVAVLESLAAQASISLQGAEQVETIRLERQRFEAVFRTVPFALLVAEDATLARVRGNPAAAALFNVPLDENLSPATPIGARVARCALRGDRPLSPDELPLARAARGEEIIGEEIELALPGGRRITALASAAPIYGGGGAVAGAVCALADITTQKALQRELDARRREAEEASVRKTRFLAAVSHDIRTPANAIHLMAEVMRRAASTPALAEQVPQMAVRLQANTLALVDLVTDVLDVARFDSGKVELTETEFSLPELAAEEARQLQPLAEQKGLALAVEPPDRPVWLRADRVKLARVIANLVGNAIKFTESGEVRLAVGLDGQRRAVIRVTDTGVGIPVEHQARIFDEFAQLRNPERDRDKGTGLGLAICKRLIEVMGGEIAVASAPGRGSTFTVTLPATLVQWRLESATLRPAPPDRPTDPCRGRLAGLGVLLVEDHAATRDSITRLLGDEGATVRGAADGAAALAALGRGGADVLLLDMMLPDLDGREVLRRLGSTRPAGLRAVVVMTGDLTPERLAEVQELGADTLIAKPIDVEKLIDMLAGLRGGNG
jgi:two-component system sensor histidine kinase EvgS